MDNKSTSSENQFISEKSNVIRRAQTVTWNEELTATWAENKPNESLSMRGARYVSYMCPSELQLKGLSKRLEDFIDEKVNSHSTNRTLVDVTKMPLPDEFSGVCYAVEFSPKCVSACRIEKIGKDVKIDLETSEMINSSKDYTASSTTAFELFEMIAQTVAKLPYDKDVQKPYKIAFINGFIKNIRAGSSSTGGSCTLKMWSRGMKTGRSTDDPVVGGDMAAMLSYALDRLKLPFEVSLSCDSTLGVLESAYATVDPKQYGRSDIRFVYDLDIGVSSAAVKTSTGELIESEICNMSQSLPLADFDLEVDDADGNYNTCLFEKLSGHKYLSEIARRVILKILQQEAPEAAWRMYSLPMNVMNKIVSDSDAQLALTKECLELCWEWKPSLNQAIEVRRVIHSVLSRSAALMAACIVAQARAFNALQPALGGSIVVIKGDLYNTMEFYREMVKQYIVLLVGKALSTLLVLVGIETPNCVGGALRQLRIEASKPGQR